jgi:hypothetical protein
MPEDAGGLVQDHHLKKIASGPAHVEADFDLFSETFPPSPNECTERSTALWSERSDSGVLRIRPTCWGKERVYQFSLCFVSHQSN